MGLFQLTDEKKRERKDEREGVKEKKRKERRVCARVWPVVWFPRCEDLQGKEEASDAWTKSRPLQTTVITITRVSVFVFLDLWLWREGRGVYVCPVSTWEILQREVRDLQTPQRLRRPLQGHGARGGDGRERCGVRAVSTRVNNRHKHTNMIKRSSVLDCE